MKNTQPVELCVAGQKLTMRLQEGKPQILRGSNWEPVARLTFKCGHSFDDGALAITILSKIKSQSR